MKLSELTNDEFISAFQTHHGKQMASLQTCGKFQGSGKYWDEFRRRLTVAAAADAVIQAAKDLLFNVSSNTPWGTCKITNKEILAWAKGECLEQRKDKLNAALNALAHLQAVRDE